MLLVLIRLRCRNFGLKRWNHLKYSRLFTGVGRAVRWYAGRPARGAALERKAWCRVALCWQPLARPTDRYRHRHAARPARPPGVLREYSSSGIQNNRLQFTIVDPSRQSCRSRRAAVLTKRGYLFSFPAVASDECAFDKHTKHCTKQYKSIVPHQTYFFFIFFRRSFWNNT